MLTILFKDRIFVLLALLFFLSGCGVWESFTTYFNLYYNARDLFDKAESQLNDQKKDVFSTEPPAIPGNVASDLQKVIEKCSNILQFSPNSSYVDDALMMLGKSFYYQKSYLKSQKKFEELITSQPNSGYILEANLWIGKCQMRLRNFTEGLDKLTEVRDAAIEEGEDEIVQEAYIEEIVYRKTINDIPGAIAAANAFLKISDDDKINAQLWYEVGNLNLEIDDKENAVAAYRNVFEYSPDYDLEVSAKLKLGKSLRELGKTEEALSIFEDMRSEDKYEDKYSDIDLELGITEAALKNYQEAIDQLTLVDTTYKSSPNSGAAKYELALVYENGLKRLDSAAVYYKKAAATTLPKEYIEPARDKNRLFTRYTSLRSEQNKYGKQLYYLLNPDEFVKDSSRYVQDSLAMAKEISNVKELQEIWSGLDTLMRGKQDTTGFYQDSSKVVDTLFTFLKDSLQYVNRDSIFSWIRNPKPQDSLLIAEFDSMLTNRTFDPNAKQVLEKRRREQENYTNQLVASLPDTLKFKNNPPKRPKISEDSLNTILAKNQLDLGNLFLSELNFPDSAYWYYNSNLTDYPNTPYYATTLFAMGTYYLTVNDKNKADSLFNIVYNDYQNENIVNAAADMLNKPLIDLTYDPAMDKYTEAEKYLLAGEFQTAVNKFKEIPELYPSSPVAPKAIYASGWLEENELNNPEQAAEYYDTLIARYPSSEYVRTIAPKINIYKQEKRKEAMALKDSLKALAHSDSLASDTLLVQEETVPTEDTIRVAVSEEDQLPVRKEEQPKVDEKKVHATKEPVWNPRKKR